MAAVAPTSRLTPLNPDPTMTYDRDTQERLIRLIQPKSAHDKMALYDAIAAVVPASARVWEPGCGSGQATRGLAGRFAHVHATDPSAARST